MNIHMLKICSPPTTSTTTAPTPRSSLRIVQQCAQCSPPPTSYHPFTFLFPPSPLPSYHPLPLSSPSPPPWVPPASVILSIPTFPPPHFSRPEMAVPLCFASLAADFNSFRPEHTPSNDDHDAELLTFCLIEFFILTTQAFG